MWEIELSFDLSLSTALEPNLKAQKIDVLEGDTLSDLVSMMAQYLSLEDYQISPIEGPRFYLRWGGIRIRATLYHEHYREGSAQIEAALKALQQLIMTSAAAMHC